VLTRSPNYYEKVVIVGRDGEGPYYSHVSRVIHIGVNGANFSLEAINLDASLPYGGGLVMSLVDAAVLGVFVRQSSHATFGVVEFCSAMPKYERRVDDGFGSAAVAVREAFNMLRPAVWPDGLLEEVFTHSSCQRYRSPSKVFNTGMAPLAFLGDAAIKVRFAELARVCALPTGRWQQDIQRSQSNETFAALAVRFRLDEYVKFGHGMARAPPGAKVYADMVEALAGAVYLGEDPDTCASFLDMLLLAAGSSVVEPLRADEAKLVRTVSGGS